MPSLSQQSTRLLFRQHESTPLGRLSMAGMLFKVDSNNFREMRVLGSYALVYLFKGEGSFRDGRGLSQAVHSGDALLLFPEIAHRYGPARGQEWNEIYVVFDGPVFDLWRRQGILCDSRPVIHTDSSVDWLAWLKQILEPKENPADALGGNKLNQITQLLELLTTMVGPGLGNEDEGPDSWLRQARDLLSGNLEREVSAASVAKEVGLSHESFRKRFVQETGVSPARFRAQQRIAAARELLLRPNYTLRAIADSLGFSDEFHFSRRFKEITGETPSEYRRTATSPGANKG